MTNIENLENYYNNRILDEVVEGNQESGQYDKEMIDSMMECVSDEYTGGSVNYYKVNILHPTTESNPPYTAECNDLVEALGMNYAEANVFKAIWRKCAAQNLGKTKKNYEDGVYDAEKAVFFSRRVLIQEKNK